MRGMRGMWAIGTAARVDILLDGFPSLFATSDRGFTAASPRLQSSLCNFRGNGVGKPFAHWAIDRIQDRGMTRRQLAHLRKGGRDHRNMTVRPEVFAHFRDAIQAFRQV